MSNQLLLIIGIKGSGKSWLADIMAHCYEENFQNSRIFEEADLRKPQHIAEIKDHVKNTGHAIVVCSFVTTMQLMSLAPDRIYNIALRGNR